LFPENTGSVKLHLKNDFRCIGTREKIAQLDGTWRDTVLYERRSKK
jgi:phosphinothricin acetyltransferase